MDWIAGLQNVIAVGPIVAIFLGVVIGLVFGAVPGLSATMAVALCLPLTFGMEAVTAMSLLVSLYIGGVSGGLVSAILIGIPGTPSSIATTFDGRPMALRGEAGRALGLAIFFSFVGGMIGFVVLFFLAPPLARFALRFGTYEYFAIAVFALTLVAGLAGKSLLRGIIAALLGLLFSTVGFAPTDAIPRFTFGFSALDGGFSLLPVLLGLFAVTEILNEVLKKPDDRTVPPVNFTSPRFPGASLRDLVENGWNALRSGAIGVGIGLLPGIGSSASNLLAYSAARSSDKKPERFGTGVPAGIVASETANNANVGAAMVPLIALGIPGDSVTAMLLGGLMIHGMQPGPLLFTNNGPLVYAVFVALLIANFAMLVISIAGIRVFVRILSVPKSYLLAVVMVTCVLGAFAVNNRVFDVYTLVGFGILGLVLTRLSIPFPPLILGFILGPLIEVNFRSALMSSRGEILPFFERPFTALFLGLALLYVVVVAGMRIRRSLAARRARAAA